jgi:hypothetical protein
MTVIDYSTRNDVLLVVQRADDTNCRIPERMQAPGSDIEVRFEGETERTGR